MNAADSTLPSGVLGNSKKNCAAKAIMYLNSSKDGLISESFLCWHESPKIFAKHFPKYHLLVIRGQDSSLAHFLEDWSKTFSQIMTMC